MRLLLKITGVLIVALLSVGFITDRAFFTEYLPRIVFHHNFHPVTPGEFYRSAQMSHTDLLATGKSYGIRTIIDLRAGEDEPDPQGYTEPATAKELGADYFHVPMFASRVPSRQTIENLINIFRTAKRPMLIHCSSGTHRTGVASAVWLLDQKGATPQDAAQQVSAYYGHVPLERRIKSLFSGQPTIDTMLTSYVSKASESPIPFEEWAAKNLQ